MATRSRILTWRILWREELGGPQPMGSQRVRHVLATEHQYICARDTTQPQKKNEIMPFVATWTQLKIIILSEVSQKKTNIMCYHLYLECKIWHKRTYLRNRNRLTGIEDKLLVAKRKWGREGTDWDFGVSRYKLLCVEWINNKVLL